MWKTNVFQTKNSVLSEISKPKYTLSTGVLVREWTLTASMRIEGELRLEYLVSFLFPDRLFVDCIFLDLI